MISPLISIIIPCYNQNRYITESIDSVVAQSYTKWECIIVDDGSTDETAQKIEKYLTDNRIRYIYQDNRGVSAARNAGIENATGDYLLFLDGDDLLTPQALEKLLVPFTQNSNTLVSFSDCETFGTENNKSSLANTFSLQDLLRRNKIFITCLIRRDDIGTDVRFEEEISSKDEDWEFWIQLFSKFSNKSPYKISYIAFKYRKHKISNMLKLKNNRNIRIEGFEFVYNKHKALYHKYFPDYITLLNRNEFYEQKLKKIYSSLPYRIYDKITKIIK